MALPSRPDQHGFTLLEMMLVVALAGVIATLAIAQYSPARQRYALPAADLLTALQKGLGLAVEQQRWYGLGLAQEGWQLKVLSLDQRSEIWRWQNVASPVLLPPTAGVALKIESGEVAVPAHLADSTGPQIWFSPYGETPLFSLELKTGACTDTVSSSGFFVFRFQEQRCDQK